MLERTRKKFNFGYNAGIVSYFFNTNSDSQKKGGFLSAEIPLWSVFLIILILALGAGATMYLLRTNNYAYNINIPKGIMPGPTLQYGSMPALSNSDYFNQVRKAFIDQKTDFIEADLSAMRVRVYNQGLIVEEVPIKTKGKDGSWWETPAGIYKIETKENNHFSSIGKVYQPWSMQFQGNFFIHGWPYHKDGTPVASTFSGGCVRLTTEDAKKVFDLAKVGMPILVYEKDFAKDNFVYSVKQPEISAEEYLVADLKSDFAILSKDANKRAPIASVTKLMTGLVAAEYINLDSEITITNSMIVTTSKPRLKSGDTYTVYNLLFPMLTESSNEAAKAVASRLGEKYFVRLMNDKAVSAGMKSSTFADPAGSDAGNVSTPEDLFALSKYLYNNRSFILKITSGDVGPSAYGDTVFTRLQNFNKIPDSNFGKFIGGKIGKTTAAGETYVGVFEFEVKGEIRPIAFIVLGSTDVYKDMQKLLEYVASTYE